jgi:F420H(2)-dependent biliverdin reductase
VLNVLVAAPTAPGSRCARSTARWAILEGFAPAPTDPAAVADAEHRQAERDGRTPHPNPDRIVIEIALTRAMGNV